jgi:hypothetical protein
MIVSVVIGILIIVVVGAICFWAIESLLPTADLRSCSSCS